MIKVEVNVSDIIMKDNEAKVRLDYAMQAGMFIVEQAYVDEAPGDMGDFKDGIKVKKDASLQYRVVSTAKRNGFNYPLALFRGTGIYRGGADSGYTSGKVRKSNNYGFGLSAKGREESGRFFGMLMKMGKIKGIRPNKVATRAKNKSQDKYIKFVSSKIKLT